MDFIEFLNKKNIDPEKFQKNDLELYLDWENSFSQMSENSFTLQKKFSINKIRRKYQKPFES
ncbi:MAG: hypothetical protein RIR51_1909 [Bacteroidota bacterium]|jgi:hypothetical protein